jgi:dihydrofolate synthase/folylpolyglutamate synthase
LRATDEILADLEQHGIRLGLENLAALLADLGEPHRTLPAVLVAGTNGKGSTSALLAEIAGAAGYRVGHYTSPHLERVEERIRVDGTKIEPAALAALLAEVVDSAARRGVEAPTYFEAMTAAALLEFGRKKVDLAVLEVGMGGRLDATNVVSPRLTVVTPVDFDHREWLGESLDAIAREKAGIFRAAVPAVLAPQLPEAETALVDEATRKGAALVPVGARLKRLAIRSQGLDGLELELASERRAYVLKTALAGEHQAANVATALVAAEELEALGFPAIDGEAITAGIERCRWPGRLEAIALPERGTTVLLDAAHNPAGCETLARFLAHLGRSYDLVFGALGDKEIAGMLPALAVAARRIVLTRPASPRAADPATLAALLSPALDVTVEPEPTAALIRALNDPADLVVVCGSIFLVGELRASLRSRFGRPSE